MYCHEKHVTRSTNQTFEPQVDQNAKETRCNNLPGQKAALVHEHAG